MKSEADKRAGLIANEDQARASLRDRVATLGRDGWTALLAEAIRRSEAAVNDGDKVDMVLMDFAMFALTEIGTAVFCPADTEEAKR